MILCGAMEMAKKMNMNTNCAQKLSSPKKEKLTVMRSIKVLATLGVHTFSGGGIVDGL